MKKLHGRWTTISFAAHKNRMIKVPATPAGIEALEELAARGIPLNVTLCFTERQYTLARDAVWRGAQRRKDGLNHFKSVYSIFISRVRPASILWSEPAVEHFQFRKDLICIKNHII